VDAHKLHGLRRITIFEAKFDYLAHTLHQRIQIFRLGVAPAQLGHMAHIEAVFVALDYNVR
jgi:hypothetical protein